MSFAPPIIKITLMLEVANTVVRLMPKYSIAMHGNAWHCSIAEDASGKVLCFHVVTVLYYSTASGQARCITEGEQPIIHNRSRVVLALSIYLLLQHVHHFQYVSAHKPLSTAHTTRLQQRTIKPLPQATHQDASYRASPNPLKPRSERTKLSADRILHSAAPWRQARRPPTCSSAWPQPLKR
jgi:hypothetical protein